MKMTEDDVWTFLEEMAKKTMQWEGFHNKASTSTPDKTTKGVTIEGSITVEAKMATLMRRLEALEEKEKEKGKPGPTV